MCHQIRKFISFKLHVCHILTLKNKSFKEKIDNYLSTQFDSKTPSHMRKQLKQDIACAIALIMFYENRKSLIFKVLGVVVYLSIDKYVYVDYLCLILTYRSKLVSYHLSKGSVITEKSSQALNNVPQTVQNHSNAINMHESDSRISCCTPIPSVANTLKNIYLGGPLWYEFTPEYYNDNDDAFVLLFQQYIASDIDNIYNLDKEAYEDNIIFTS